MGIILPTYAIIIINIISFFDFITIYLEPNRIAKRIQAISWVGPHNQDILSIFCGSLQGKAQAEYRSTGNNTRIGFYLEAWQSEYLQWLHNFIAQLGYCNLITPKIQKRFSAASFGDFSTQGQTRKRSRNVWTNVAKDRPFVVRWAYFDIPS